MIRLIILFMMVLSMAGCGFNKPQVIEKTTIKYVVIDDAWLAPCVMVLPPDKALYKSKTPTQRADLWARKYLDQAGINGDCNIRLNKALDYNRKKAASTTTITCTDGVCN